MCIGTEPGTPNYPDSLFNSGQILTLENDWYVPTKMCYGIVKAKSEKYPHLFRPMPWYEGRTADEMPEYVKNVNRVYKLSDEKVITLVLHETGCIILDHGNDCQKIPVIPATEQEYLEYQNSKK